MAQLGSVTNALNQVTSYAYDAVGNLTSATDARNNATAYAYTARNQLSSVTDPLNRATTFAYDNAGNRTSATDPLGNATTYVYDALNRVVEAKDPLLNTTVVAYDEVGNTTSVRDPLLNATSYTYDALNRLTRTTDPQANQTNLAYDANSRLTSVTDAMTRVTTYAYNSRGQLTSTTNPLNQVWSRAYDAKGRLTSTTDPKSQASSFGYDAADRLTSLTYVGQSAVTYAYNAASALTSMVDSTGTTTYNRDALYRLTSVVTPDGLGGVKTVSYGYDAAGNRTSLTYPDAKQVTYAYDAADQLTGVTDWSAGAASLTYDNAGRPTALNLPNGTRQSYTYDAASRVTGIAYRGPVDAVIGDVGSGYDANSRRTSLTDSEGTTTFGHDTLNRLTSAAYPNGTTSYLYDAVGNRTSMRARWYDPAIGRFISKDPIRGSTSTPQSLNPYAYVGNNPCGLRDPSGEFFLPPSGPIGYELSPLPPVAWVGAGAAAMEPIHRLNRELGNAEFAFRFLWERLGPPECVLPPPPPLKPLKPLPPMPEFHDTGCRRIECMAPQFAEYWRWRAAMNQWSPAALAVIRENGVTGLENIQKRVEWAKEAIQGIRDCYQPVPAPPPGSEQSPPGRCVPAVVAAALGITALLPAEYGLAWATIAAAQTVVGELVLVPADISVIYLNLQFAQLVWQGARSTCQELKIQLNPVDWFREQ